jgi:hypothetical protein
MKTIIPFAIVWACMGAWANAAELQVHGLPPRMWGDTVARPVVQAGDVEAEGPLALLWALTAGPYVVEGEIRGLAAPFEQELEVKTPDVRARTALAFETRLLAGGKVLAEGRTDVSLLPRGRLEALAGTLDGRRIGLVTVGEAARDWAAALPVVFIPLPSGPAVGQFEGDMILMVATERPSPLSDLVGALRRRLEEGLRLVCIGDAGAVAPLTDWEGADGAALVQARVLAPSHASLSGLLPGDLARWGADGAVASGPLVWPETGNTLTVLDAGPGHPPGALMAELRRGKGRLLFCGLAVVQKLADEPVAELVLANLIGWGLQETAPLARCIGCIGPDSGAAAALADLGVDFAAGPMGPDDVLIADGSLMGEDQSDLLARVLREGGTILLSGLDAEGLGTLNRALQRRWRADVRARPPELSLTPADAGALAGFTLEGANPKLAGVRPEDVQALAEETEPADWQAVRAAEDSGHFVDLAGAGLLAKFERDGVRIVFWQVPLSKKLIGPQRRVLAAVLTNLNVPLRADH